MEDQFVPYELALELKKLGIDDKGKFNPKVGFNEPCFARYRRGRFQLNTLGKPHRYNSDEIVKGDVSAPLWQQAFKFIQSKVDLHQAGFELSLTSKEWLLTDNAYYWPNEKALKKLIELISQ